MANTPGTFRNGAVAFIDWLGGGCGFMPSVFWNSKLFAGELLRKLGCVLQVIMRAALSVEDVNIKSRSFVFFDDDATTVM
jgi:hypothetical protein